MALDLKGADMVRKKIATFKSKIQDAEKRSGKAKESLQLVQESFNSTRRTKARVEALISKRESQLEKVESLISIVQRKWDAFNRFLEEITNTRVAVSMDTRGSKDVSEIDTTIATIKERTKIAERKCITCAKREHELRMRTKTSRERCIQLETTAISLQEELAALRERVEVLQQSRKLRATRKLQMERLESKVQLAIARAQENENLESELENRVIELEDQIEMYTMKKKRTSSFLEQTNSEKSIEPWTVTLWLRSSRLVNGSPSSVPALPNSTE
ncbi:myosin heavy chain, clone 203-like [Stylophora pistillata]|uniref:Uncharacterized protein n=1 Tax=Stylophora pistillata TaxID=50429 RepID=A0A2B4RW83_STYPI|nr:myosin heavy chain, clone 203-like [Stylophora pistillata]PFX22714.1 hypothetical protein AWC38_SpisGene12745 [Stylophora pistillata]